MKFSTSTDSHVRVDLNLNIRNLKKSATLEINEKSRHLQQQGKRVFRLGFGQSPFPVPAPVVRALQAHAHEKDYLDVQGLWQLRDAIAGFYKRRHGLDRTAEDILIGPGSKELLFLLQLVYYGNLVIPSPSWVSYSPQATIVGRHVQWLDTSRAFDFRLTPEDLDNLCKKDPDRPRIVILNYPSNPTGSTYRIERLQELAEVAKKYRVILLADEIYGELHHRGEHVSIAKFYPEGTIVSTGLSKWCGAGGWRLGAFIFPKSLAWLREAMAIVASETYTSTSAPIQYAAVTAFQENVEIDEYLQKAQRILGAIGNTVHQHLQDMNVHAPVPQGGFYLFPDFEYYRENLAKRGITTSVELCDQLLEETGIAFLPSSDFGRPPQELTVRLSYVDFDGQQALDLASANQNGTPLGHKYVQQAAPRMMEAMESLKNWLQQ